MSSKRSYLDSLNAGRSRKAHASLEELNRSLESLGHKLDRSREVPPLREERAPRRSQWAETDMNFRERPSEDWRSRATAPRQRMMEPAYAPRREDDGSAARIAAELKGLREELRQQMTAGIRREFDVLRSEVERASASPASVRADAELGVEFERLSDAIAALSERGDDKNINMLRLELEQVKGVLDSLAREETVLSVDRRWDDFNKRWSTLENRLSGSLTKNGDPALGALSARLEQISDAVNGLPESLSLRSLEDKVRSLAGAVDQFTSQQDRRGSDFNALIEERLDEISRAIVASTSTLQTPHVDPEPFEPIEARITSLAHQLEALAEDRPSGEVIDRLSFLCQRVDEIAERASVPEKSVERLGRQIAAIADRIENTPPAMDAEHILPGAGTALRGAVAASSNAARTTPSSRETCTVPRPRAPAGRCRRAASTNAVRPSLDNSRHHGAPSTQRFSATWRSAWKAAVADIGRPGVLIREPGERGSTTSPAASKRPAPCMLQPASIRTCCAAWKPRFPAWRTHLSRARRTAAEFERHRDPASRRSRRSIATNRDTILETASPRGRRKRRASRTRPHRTSDTVTVAGLAR